MKYIHVRVVAGASKESFVPKYAEKNPDEYFVAKVKEKAEHNLANIRVTELVAEYFHVPTSAVRIVNGHKHPSKLLVLED